jgi:hypothetical protein
LRHRTGGNRLLDGDMVNLFRVGRNFEDEVHSQFVALQEQGLVKILGRNLRLTDKDGIPREIDLVIQLFGPLHSVNVCIECKKRKSVKIDTIDRIRALRLTLPHKNYIIISNGKVSGPTMRAAEADNIPVILYRDLKMLVLKMMGDANLPEDQRVASLDGWKFAVGSSSQDEFLQILKTLNPNWTEGPWPYLVTSKTQLGSLMFQWICDANDIDWREFDDIISDGPAVDKN